MHIYMRIKRKNSYGNWLTSVHLPNAIHTLKRGLVTGHCWRTAKKCAAAGSRLLLHSWLIHCAVERMVSIISRFAKILQRNALYIVTNIHYVLENWTLLLLLATIPSNADNWNSVSGLFVPLTIRTVDCSYHRPFVPFFVIVNFFFRNL